MGGDCKNNCYRVVSLHAKTTVWDTTQGGGILQTLNPEWGRYITKATISTVCD